MAEFKAPVPDRGSQAGPAVAGRTRRLFAAALIGSLLLHAGVVLALLTRPPDPPTPLPMITVEIVRGPPGHAADRPAKQPARPAPGAASTAGAAKPAKPDAETPRPEPETTPDKPTPERAETPAAEAEAKKSEAPRPSRTAPPRDAPEIAEIQPPARERPTPIERDKTETAPGAGDQRADADPEPRPPAAESKPARERVDLEPRLRRAEPPPEMREAGRRAAAARAKRRAEHRRRAAARRAREASRRDREAREARTRRRDRASSQPRQQASAPAGRLVPPKPGAGSGRNRPPSYPRRAQREGWQGRVLLLVSVTAGGQVASVGVRKSSGHGILDRAALRAVRRWRFRPAPRGGRPVAGSVVVPVTFRLGD